MSDITNLTDRITRLRDHKNKVGIARTGAQSQAPMPEKKKVKRERRFATDYFMLFTYSLLGAAILSQFFLIVWLDII